MSPMIRALANRFGAFLRAPGEFRTPSGVILPPGVTEKMAERYMNPIAVPDDLIPDSVREGGGNGRVMHLIQRRKVPKNPGEGPICEDCAHYRYEAGQEWIRRHGSPFQDAPKVFGCRAPRDADMGMCAAKDGDALVHRFATCPEYRHADEVITSADKRKGRRFDPIRYEMPVKRPGV